MKNYHFNEFILHNEKALSYGGKKIALPPKELAVLRILLKNAKKVVPKEKLLLEVWKEKVSDGSLARCICNLRKIFGVDKKNCYVETIYGYGYRLTAQVRESIIIAEQVSSVCNTNSNMAKNTYNNILFNASEGCVHTAITLSEKKSSSDTLCNLVAIWMSLAMLGIISYGDAAKIISVITNEILVSEPSNVQALEIRAFMIASNIKEVESELHLAMILSPHSAEVYYYYASYLFRMGNLSKAMEVSGMSISLKPTFLAARLLQIVINVVEERFLQAVEIAENLKGRSESTDLIIDVFLVIILRRNGNDKQYNEKMNGLKKYREKSAVVRCVHRFMKSGMIYKSNSILLLNSNDSETLNVLVK